MQSIKTRIAKLEHASGRGGVCLILDGRRTRDVDGEVTGAVTARGNLLREADEPLEDFKARYFASLGPGTHIPMWIGQAGELLR